MHCREHVVQLHHSRNDITGAGGTLIVVGNGSPSFIAGFRDETGYDGPLYTDPSLAVYRVLELRRGWAATFDPRALGNAARALRAGFRQGRVQGDATQQGGVIVVGTDGRLRYRHADRWPGDQAPVADVIAAIA